MARDYRQLTRGPGVFVPTWLAVLIVLGAGLYFTARILVPPSFIVKRLEAPDGSRTAQLMRTQQTRQHFTIRVKEDWLWRTMYYSPAITNSFKVDLGERLVWSEDSERLFLEMKGKTVWGHDFKSGTGLRPAAAAPAQ